jgi:ribosomal-protein-alanine N-acetyltransferase
LRIETERLEIRPMRAEDAEQMHEVYSDPSTYEYIGADPAQSVEETFDRIEGKAAHQAEHGFSLWSLVERESGRVVGHCGIQMLEGGPEVELGYALARAARGRGYATEAGRACLRYGFEDVGLDRIVAVAWPENAASRGVMEKLGMRLVGPGRHYGSETVLYAITREEFAAQAG